MTVMTETKAYVTDVPIGNFTLEGLMDENGKFYVGVPQITEKFQFDSRQASRGLKPLLATNSGSTFEYTKLKTELNPKAINAVPLKAFEALLVRLAIERNHEVAKTLLLSLAGAALEKFFAMAFDVKMDDEAMQQAARKRQIGKLTRRSLTDAINDYIVRNNKSGEYKTFIYSNCSDALNNVVLGCRSKAAKEYYQLPKSSILRDHLPPEAIDEIEHAERIAQRLIDEQNIEPLTAVKQAAQNAMTKLIGLGHINQP